MFDRKPARPGERQCRKHKRKFTISYWQCEPILAGIQPDTRCGDPQDNCNRRGGTNYCAAQHEKCAAAQHPKNKKVLRINEKGVSVGRLPHGNQEGKGG